MNVISSKEHSNLIYGTSIATCMPLEKGSLILLDYTAKIKDTGNVIETTIEEDAKRSGSHDPSHSF